MGLEQGELELLQQGEIVSCELTPAGSNYTFLARLRLNDRDGLAIYKPRDGEVPLWDFPSGTLYKRECAAYLLSEILGWDFIPYTLILEGPYGIGSMQSYVEHDPMQNYHILDIMGDADSAEQLRRVACFDLVANNTDRKGGHVLKDTDGKLWGIDQALTFHADTKIRTVIWDFAGDPIPEDLLQTLEGFCRQLAHPQGRIQELLDMLLPEEIGALHRRLQWVLTDRVYPGVPGRRRR